MSKLQDRVLVTLAPLEPPWTLTGGGALAGIHLGHRTTRDLDLFWHGRTKLDTVPTQVRTLLKNHGLDVRSSQTEPAFHQLLVSASGERVVVDLVADPVGTVDSPIAAKIGNTQFLVDSTDEIFANKLCALLGRAELRDLVDVRALLATRNLAKNRSQQRLPQRQRLFATHAGLGHRTTSPPPTLRS